MEKIQTWISGFVSSFDLPEDVGLASEDLAVGVGIKCGNSMKQNKTKFLTNNKLIFQQRSDWCTWRSKLLRFRK